MTYTEIDVHEAIKAAQAAPLDHYLVSAVIEVDGVTSAIPIEVSRVAPGLDVGVVERGLRQRVRDRLTAIGFEDDVVENARFDVEPLPDALAEADRLAGVMEAGGDDLALFDTVFWEAYRLQTGREPQPSEVTNDLEFLHKGLHIIRAASA